MAPLYTADQWAYESHLKETAPVLKGILASYTALLCISVGHMGFSALVLVFSAAVCIGISGTPAARYFKLCAVPAGFLVIGVITIAMQSHPQAASILAIPFFDTYLCFTVESMLQALSILLKSLACVSCFYFLYLTTPVGDILGMLYRSPLPKTFVEIMMLTYRFIFVMLDTMERMHSSQKSRLGNTSFRTSWRSAAILASGVFVRSFKRSGDILSAMESRGYDGAMPYLQEKRPMTGREKLVMMLYIPAVLIIAAGFLWVKW